MTKLLVLLVMLIPSVAAADPNADAARWVDTLFHGKKIDAPAKPVVLVFDSGKLFKSDSPCAKLRVVGKATTAELTTLATCVSDAAKQLGLDGQKLPDAKALSNVGQKYLRSWFASSLASSIVIPAGHKALGASISRPTNSEGAGLGIMIYVVYDPAGTPTAIYAYAGHWAYPV